MSPTLTQRFLAGIGWGRLPLRRRILLVLALLVAVTMAGPLLTLWYAYTARGQYTATVEGDFNSFVAAQELESGLAMQKGYATYFILSGDPDWLDKLEGNRRAFRGWLAKAKAEAALPNALGLLGEIETAYRSYAAAKDEAIALYRKGDREAGAKLHWEARRQFDKVYAQCEQLKFLYQDRISRMTSQYLERTKLVMWLVFGAIPILAILTFSLSFMLFRQVLDPLRLLARGVPGQYGDEDIPDEIKAISRRFSSLVHDMDQVQSDLAASRGLAMQTEKLALAGKLAAGVAHTIRNPLTSVKMRLFSLERSLSLNPSQKDDFEVIAEEIAYIDSIVRNFLEFARPPKLEARPVRLSDVVDTALKLLKHKLESYGVTVEVKRDKAFEKTNVDPDQIKEVLVNLIVNACEAMGEGGHIVIREEGGFMEPLGRVDVIRISDDGPGVPEGLRETIFQPFFTSKGEGSGLGLAIARRIMEEHGGWINLHSPEGRGATFALVFPAGQEKSWHRQF